MFGIDWSDLQIYHYLAIGGGGLALLSLLLYFALPSGLKIPAGILGTVAGLVAGMGIGVIGMAAYGYQLPKEPSEAAEADPNAPAVPPAGKGMAGKGMAGKGMPGMGMPGMGMPGMGGPGGGKGFGKGKGPSSKTQLTQLVGKMAQLTDKPLSLTLTDEQRSVIRDQLKVLPDKEELSDDDAKKCLDAILDAIQDKRDVLTAAGYSWPTKGGGIQAPPVSLPNPFKDGPALENLQSLQKRLAK